MQTQTEKPRERIYQAIIENPGLRRYEIAQRLGISRRMIYYYVLQMLDLCISEDDCRRLFPCKYD